MIFSDSIHQTPPYWSQGQEYETWEFGCFTSNPDDTPPGNHVSAEWKGTPTPNIGDYCYAQFAVQ